MSCISLVHILLERDSILANSTGDVWQINGNFQVVKETLPNKSMSSRSLFFASTTLSGNEGLTKLEVGFE